MRRLKAELRVAADDPTLALEAQRQQLLLRVLWRREPAAALAAWLREDGSRIDRALVAYRANAEAAAARALAAAYPTVAALVGDDAMRAIAAAHWHRCPPEQGDLARFGATLPEALAADRQLAELPYLADVARLDWAVHGCESAADADAALDGIERLADTDPAALALALRPGTAVLRSDWPIVTIRQAHAAPADAPDRFAASRAALARGDREIAIVRRRGWRAVIERSSAAEARFTAALLSPGSLAAALDEAGAGFDFESWLLRALREGWLHAVRRHGASGPIR